MWKEILKRLLEEGARRVRELPDKTKHRRRKYWRDDDPIRIYRWIELEKKRIFYHRAAKRAYNLARLYNFIKNLTLRQQARRAAIQSVQHELGGISMRFEVDKNFQKSLSEYARVSGATLGEATIKRGSNIMFQMWKLAGKEPGVEQWLQGVADKKAAILSQKVGFPKKGPSYTFAGHIVLKRGSKNPLPGDQPGGSIRRLVFKKSRKGNVEFESGGEGHHQRLRDAASMAIELAKIPDRSPIGYAQVSIAGAAGDAVTRGIKKFKVDPSSKMVQDAKKLWFGDPENLTQAGNPSGAKKMLSNKAKVGFGYATGTQFQPRLVMTARGELIGRFGHSLLRKAINADIEDMDKQIEKKMRKKGFL